VIPRIFFALTALVWLPYGIFCFFQPGYLAQAAGVTATSATGTIELRAMYGGLQAGIGAFALAAALRPAVVGSALIASSFMFAGLALTRLAAAIGTGDLSSYTVFALGLEWVSTLVAVWLLRQHAAAAST
jgi:Domain of unknown function (DUF4345)